MTSAPETERPESSEPSESPEASRPRRPRSPTPARPAARAARRADGARGGAVRAGAAVRAGVGERADGQLAEGPGPPGVHAAQPHRVPAAGARRHGHLRGRPAGAGGRPDRPAGRSSWPPSSRPGRWRWTRAWSSPSGGDRLQVRAMGRVLVDDPLAGACTYTITGREHGPAGVPGRHPGPARPDGAGPHAGWPARTTPCSPCRATAPSWPAPPRPLLPSVDMLTTSATAVAPGALRVTLAVDDEFTSSPDLLQAGADRAAGGVAAGHGGAARCGWTAGRSGRRGRDGSAGRGSSTSWCPW